MSSFNCFVSDVFTGFYDTGSVFCLFRDLSSLRTLSFAEKCFVNNEDYFYFLFYMYDTEIFVLEANWVHLDWFMRS